MPRRHRVGYHCRVTGKGPPTPPGRDRRRHTRYDIFAQIQLRRGADVSVLPVLNISAGGVLVELAEGEHPAVRPGETVDVFLDTGDLEQDSSESFETAAEVVRVDLGGPGRRPTIALMWTSDDPAMVEVLGRILTRMRAAPI